ncbi:BTAD domain-containing putative transcriptional regulator [Amycolatopsis lurida]
MGKLRSLGEHMEFRILGPLTIYDGARRLEVGTPRTRALLAILLTTPNQLVSIDRLIDELWPDDPPPDARTLIHSYVSRLRRVSGTTARRLVTRKPGYLLRVDEQELDLHRYERLVADARHADNPRERVDLLLRADQLWHGAPFADVPPTPAVAAAVTKLGELRLAALEERFDAALATKQNVVTELTELVAKHPLREQLVSQLMIALRDAGRRADALALHQRTIAALRDELGVDPGPVLRQAHQTVIADRAPERVPCQPPSQLPPLVGQDDALATGQRVLSSPTPWLAVTGPAGVGKTTFALRLAEQARVAYPGGVFVTTRGAEPVDESMLTRFLSAFGIPAGGQLPGNPHDRAAMLWELLGARRVLIVLDDVPDETYVRPLLPVAPGCGLVVTSRRRLAGLAEFHSLPLEVLPVDAGVRLLRAMAGARRVDEYAGLIVKVCGGLPLAIKVAAARLSTRPNWTVDDLVRRLTDTRSRLDWLRLGDLEVRACLVESASGLTEDQQRLLRRLGLLDTAEFAGWVTAALLDRKLWAAERVLDDLVEAHLVEPAGRGVTGPRYRMHELIRLVAAELAGDDDLAAITRLRHGWLALATAADDQLAHWFGVDPSSPPDWLPPEDTVTAVSSNPLGWFDEEHDALMAAVRGGGAVAWDIAQRMTTYQELRGRYQDWYTTLRAGLAAADALRDKQGQATMLGLLMHAESTRDEHQAGMRYAVLAYEAYQALDPEAPPLVQAPTATSAALEDARRRGDVLAVGVEACRLAIALRLEGARVDYLALFEEARDAFRLGKVPLLELWTIKNVGLAYLRQRRFIEAVNCLTRGRAIFRAAMDEVVPGGDLAGVATAHGRPDLAEQLAKASLTDANRMGDAWSAARALHALADARASRGDPAAARTYRKALAVWTDLRMPRRVAQVEEAMARLT